ncbi:TPA: ATP-dependent helicase [Candidatus Dojkabacteria bacterium]|uniref:DNA 3'-5' helicase n=1 Tax=Candidatus Dojkabacteria bacterium TaxID=2099670 RepID=A0A832QDR5_9BACT|nr:ATP-dependent helicase [Candidatus Dojkabacteria bacterium]
MGQIRLNENQKKAVEYKDGDLLIIAGAGTGKTAVITQRILHIIKNEWAKPSEILALTFTEKAAEEMQIRVDQEMEYGYDEPVISTFHSFCDRILREDGYNIGIDGDYSLMSAAQSYIFTRRHIYDLGFKTLLPKGNPTKFINDFLDHISKLQNEDVSPEEYIEYAKQLPHNTDVEKEEYVKSNELAQAYKKYADLKIENSRLDFGDLILLTIKLFREKKSILEKYRKRFKYILVDEFQDTNYTQNVLVNILKKGVGEKEDKNSTPCLTVVGDDDQSIYKFRGAAISNILQFKEEYPDAQEIVLTENYRSRQEILDASHTLIKHNDPNRLEVTEGINKKLVAKAAFAEDSNAVNLMVSHNENYEAERVAEEILKLTGYSELRGSIEDRSSQTFDEKGQSTLLDSLDGTKEAKYKFSDIAILVRANTHADGFIQTLRNKGIRYKLGGARGLYFRPEIKNIISFLRVLVDYKDEVSMFGLLTMKTWNLTPREYMELIMLAKEEKMSMLEFLESEWKVKIGSDEKQDFKNIDSNIIDKVLSPEAIAGVSSLLLLLDVSAKKIKEQKSLVDILYDFVMESGYINEFLEEDTSENLFAIGNINKFFELVKNYEKDNPDSNIYEYVEFLNYSIQTGESPLVDQIGMEELDAVNILTVHSAKGLEFPVVFLVNLVSDRFPSRSRKDALPIPDTLVKETILRDISEAESNLQEERRLFYVGATRAKERVYFTAAQYYGEAKRRKKPSIFLQEVLDRSVDEDFTTKIEEDDMMDDVTSLRNMKKGQEQDVLIEDSKNLVKRFSYSQLNTYEGCPRKYEYAYVIRIPTRGTPATAFGSSVHNTLDDFYSLLKKSKEGLGGIVDTPTKEDLLSFYEKNWISKGYDSREQENARKREGEEIMERYYDKVFSEDENPFLLEESFAIHLGEVVFSGKIDRIDLVQEQDGIKEVCIVDYKTGADKTDADIKKDLQLPLYALVAEEKLGLKVVGAKYVFVESGNVAEVDVSQAKRELAKESVLDVLEKIQKGEFTATPSFGCRFCDFNTICQYADL